jgi:hypothetical protein
MIGGGGGRNPQSQAKNGAFTGRFVVDAQPTNPMLTNAIGLSQLK